MSTKSTSAHVPNTDADDNADDNVGASAGELDSRRTQPPVPGPDPGFPPLAAPREDLAVQNDLRPDPPVVATYNGGQRLLTEQETAALRARWDEIQLTFAQDPLAAVQGADVLLQEIVAAVRDAVEERGAALAGGWGGSSGLEELRLAMWQYRSFIGLIL